MRLLIPLSLFLLTSCGSPNDPGVGGVTKAEADQLNEAAELLNQNTPPPHVANDAAKQAPTPPAK
jgi:hypothetical protein